jgi:hypothetical protein
MYNMVYYGTPKDTSTKKMLVVIPELGPVRTKIAPPTKPAIPITITSRKPNWVRRKSILLARTD